MATHEANAISKGVCQGFVDQRLDWRLNEKFRCEHFLQQHTAQHMSDARIKWALRVLSIQVETDHRRIGRMVLPSSITGISPSVLSPARLPPE
jgi:hypothetical protein